MKLSNKISLALGVSILSACSHSGVKQNQPSYCQSSRVEVVRRYHPAVQPRYFFKSVGEGSEIAFSGYDEKADTNQNYLFHLATQKLTAIPGELDPIGLYQSDLLTVPVDDGRGGTKMNFYDLRDLREFGVNAKPILQSDTSLMGRYQSLGVLEKAGSKVKFRIITDGNGGGNYRDFEADFSTRPLTLKALIKTKKLCLNLRDRKSGLLQHKLPMLSKDGQKIALFDLDAQLMKVYKIDTDHSSCVLYSSPFPSRGDIGKFDFNEDSTRVAFHYSDRTLELSPQTFGTPQAFWQLRSAIFDSKQNAYQLLPFLGKNANTFYPTFLPNGNVMFLQFVGEEYEFVEVDLKKSAFIAKTKVEQLSRLSDSDFVPYQALSNYFVDRCFTEPTQSMRSNRILGLLSLSRDQCIQLSRDAAEARKLNPSELIAACEGLS